MSEISAIHGREIPDSRNNPTLEADVWLPSGARGRAARQLRGCALLGWFVLSWTTTAACQSDPAPAPPAFRFDHEAGTALRALWEASVAAREERVACLKASIRNDTVFVSRIAAVASQDADSMGISATASVDQCGPPQWSGTVHTHIAEYDNGQPSSKFSGQDRIAMRLWYDHWHADGVFCLVYSSDHAHCEADGVVGGLRSKPRLLPY